MKMLEGLRESVRRFVFQDVSPKRALRLGIASHPQHLPLLHLLACKTLYPLTLCLFYPWLQRLRFSIFQRRFMQC